MKKCFRMFLIISLLIVSLSLSFTLAKTNTKIANSESESKTRDEGEVYSLTFNQLGGSDVMPIGVWWGPYYHGVGSMNGNNLPDYLTDEYFKILLDLGVNFITVSNDNYPVGGVKADSVMKALELSEKYNLGYFVYDSFIKDIHNKDEMVNEIKNYINSDACLGIHLIDEPTADKFNGFKDAYQIFEELDFKDKVLYTNLFPNYVKNCSGTKEVMMWKDYIDLFLETTNQKFLSFDHYPFSEAGEGIGSKSQFFNALFEAKEVADKHKVPMWVFIQAGGQWNDSRKFDREFLPDYESEAEFLWNVNINLAFGAKAIQYFLYIQPYYYGYAKDDLYDTTHNSLLGASGKKNEWYYYAEKMNKQINAIDEVLMNSSNEGIIAIGENAKRNIIDHETLSNYYELIDVDAKDVIIGCFNYKGKTALYVVSNNVDEKQTCTLKFDNKYSYSVIQRAIEKEVTMTDSINLTLEKGEGILVVIE